MPKSNPHKGKARRARRLELAERRKQTADLLRQGCTQQEIATRLNVSEGTVSLDLKAVKEEWLQSSLQDFDVIKSQEMAQLDAVAAAAWQGWLRSQQPTKKEPEVQRPGDPAFLTQIRECAVAKLRVIGALQPNQTNVNVNTNLLMAGVLATGEEPEPLTMEQRIQAMVQERLEQQPTEEERLLAEKARLEAEVER